MPGTIILHGTNNKATPLTKPKSLKKQQSNFEKKGLLTDSKHSAIRAVGHRFWRRRCGKEAPVARTSLVVVHRELALQPQGTARHKHLIREHTRIVQEVTRGHVVRRVDHNIEPGQNENQAIRHRL